MTSISPSRSSYRNRSSTKDRAGALALAIGLVVLLLWMLVKLGFLPADIVPIGPRMATFDVAPGEASPQVSETQKPTPQRPQHKAAAAASAAAPPAKAPPPPPPPPVPMKPSPSTPSSILSLDGSDFAATDIGKMGHAPSDDADSDDSGNSAGTKAYGPGEGPGGERIFSVAWYREPTHAELAFY